ncbi:hypothetical protein AB205_0042460 [Aquarana catesbeiana]|uniref:Bromo domain-containing protein n=1 Tax=Aquarana catesbeiana TaxID=8400 RepID=A0A2G9RCS8_AQUCT|nr:hypothetical protein AB205_0042460 [Aquarana catesbeiana]
MYSRVKRRRKSLRRNSYPIKTRHEESSEGEEEEEEVSEVVCVLPKGCLFYGPPGTGKTLVARALANECSQGDRKVSFFMRKGADCLSKWVGESERQLRLLFDQVFREARRTVPSVVYMPHIGEWWEAVSETVRATFLTLLQDIPSFSPILLLSTSETVYGELPEEVKRIFRSQYEEVIVISRPDEEDRFNFFQDLILSQAAMPPPKKKNTDYLEVIREPMDLSTIMTKIDKHHYMTVRDFLLDVDLICSNALEYNPDKEPGVPVRRKQRRRSQWGRGIIKKKKPNYYLKKDEDSKFQDDEENDDPLENGDCLEENGEETGDHSVTNDESSCDVTDGDVEHQNGILGKGSSLESTEEESSNESILVNSKTALEGKTVTAKNQPLATDYLNGNSSLDSLESTPVSSFHNGKRENHSLVTADKDSETQDAPFNELVNCHNSKNHHSNEAPQLILGAGQHNQQEAMEREDEPEGDGKDS